MIGEFDNRRDLLSAEIGMDTNSYIDINIVDLRQDMIDKEYL
jgi:hypothetical protein